MHVPVNVLQIYMYNSDSRTSRKISLNASLEAIYVHHMLTDTTYTIQMSAVTRKGEGVLSQLIVIGMLYASYSIAHSGGRQEFSFGGDLGAELHLSTSGFRGEAPVGLEGIGVAIPESKRRQIPLPFCFPPFPSPAFPFPSLFPFPLPSSPYFKIISK